jgi:hypothetical protein
MTETQEADGPLINVSGQPEAEAATDQNNGAIPLHDEPAPESKADPIERPEGFPEKFWTDKGPDVDKLLKSYTELEKQFKSGKHKAPEEYDISALVDRGLDQEDPSMEIFKDWAKENGVSQAAFEELAGKILEATGAQSEAFEVDRQAEMSKLGERAQDKIAMTERLLMKAPLSEDERSAIASGLDNADAINAFLKYHQAITNEGIPVAPAVNTPAITREDLEAAIADPRWKTDQAFRSRIERQWMESQVA